MLLPVILRRFKHTQDVIAILPTVPARMPFWRGDSTGYCRILTEYNEWRNGDYEMLMEMTRPVGQSRAGGLVKSLKKRGYEPALHSHACDWMHEVRQYRVFKGQKGK
jgi:hypothetical protein